MDTPTGNGSASTHAAISPRPIGAATRTRATAVPSHGRDPPSRHLTGMAPPAKHVTRPPPEGTRPGRLVRRRTPPAVWRVRGRTDPGSRGHVGGRTGLCRGGAAVRSACRQPAGPWSSASLACPSTLPSARPTSTPTTVQTRRPPAIHRTHTSPPRAPGRRVLARRSRLVRMWGRVPEDHPGERGSRVPRKWRRLAHDSSRGCKR